jgi:hypothetical protein
MSPSCRKILAGLHRIAMIIRDLIAERGDYPDG